MPVQTRSMTKAIKEEKQIQAPPIRASIPVTLARKHPVSRWDGTEWIFGPVIAAKVVSLKALTKLGYKPLEYIDGKLKVCPANQVSIYNLKPEDNLTNRWAIAPDGYVWQYRQDPGSFRLIKM